MALQDKETEVFKIIQKIATTGKCQLDENMMKKLRSICRLSPVYVNYAYYAIMNQLMKDHSEIRYNALLVTNELFCRSSTFRKLLELHLDEFLQLVVETNPYKPLPSPEPIAKELKIKGLECMQNWCTRFGGKYARLQLALTYLKKCIKADFSGMEARSIAENEKRLQHLERRQRIWNEKVEKVKKEMEELTNKIPTIVGRMEKCFRLFSSHPTDPPSPLYSENGNSSCDSSSTNSSEDSEIEGHENDNILPVIQNLSDLHKQVITTCLLIISNWTKILSKGKNCSEYLQQAVDLRQTLELSREKYKELNIEPCASNRESPTECSSSNMITSTNGSHSAQLNCSQGSTSAAPSTENIIENGDSELPTVQSESHHESHETEGGDGNQNEAVKEVQIASLKIRKIDFSGKFEPVKWSCRAPLPNGKLCPRKDRYKCPHHGIIIKRNAVGNPINVDETATTSQTSVSDPELLIGNNLPDWQDPEQVSDVNDTAEMNVKIPRKKRKTEVKGKGKVKLEKDDIPNMKFVKSRVQDRLSKKILKRYKHFARKLDYMGRNKYNEEIDISEKINDY